MTQTAPTVVVQATGSPADLDTSPVEVSISKLKLEGQLQSTGVHVDTTTFVDVDITKAVTGGTMTDSMTGAPQLILTCLDRDLAMLNSGIFAKIVEVSLDQVPYRLMEVEVTGTDTLSLTFYHKLVALLMGQRQPLKVARDTTTRAQFFELMLKEIVADLPGLIFACPEINVVQPVAGGKKTGRVVTKKVISTGKKTTSTSTSGGTGGTGGTGFNVHSLSIPYYQGGQIVLGAQQLANAAIVLEVCAQVQAPAKAILSIMEACIVESNLINTSGGDGSSVGILQVTNGTASAVPGGNRNDVAACAEGFLKTGYWKYGSCLSLVRNHPEYSAGTIAQMTQGSAYPARYDMQAAGAKTVIGAYQGGGPAFSAAAGGGGASGISTTTVTTKKYEFTRGQPGQTEDSWTCMLRLASEVGWRVFVTGRSTLWFVTDDDLLKAPPTYEITPETVGVAQPTFVFEVGGRTVVLHGKRQPKVSEGQVAARIDLLEANVGDIISVAGYGPGDSDGWPITQIDRDLFDRVATLYFKAPQAPRAEPAAQTTTSTSQSGLNVGSAGRGAPTGGTAGLVSPFPRKMNLTQPLLGHVDAGVDFGLGYSAISVGMPIMALGDCYCRSAASFYTGSINPQALWFELVDKNASGYWGWYVAEQIVEKVSPGPNLIRAGTPVAEYASAGTGIEIGWAAAAGQTACAAFHSSELSSRHAGNGTTEGRAFLSFLQKVGAV